MEGIGWFASQDKGKVYFVQADSEIHGNEVRTSAPKAFSYEYTSVLDTGSSASASSDNSMIFRAYGGGHYIGSSRTFSQASILCGTESTGSPYAILNPRWMRSGR